MASQNRGNYARYNAGGNRGLAVFRGAFILLTALTLSFGLGFFVIARMMPGGQPPNSGNAGGSVQPASNHDGDKNRAPNPHPAPSTNPPPVPTPPPAGANPEQDGPTILPDSGVQKPDKIDESGKHVSSTEESPTTGSPTTGSNDKSTADRKTAPASDTPASGDGDSEPTPKKSHRDHSGAASDGGVQPAGSPDSGHDSEETDRSANTKNQNGTPDAEAGPKSGLYRVQIGVYSTREKAEEIAKSATEKGFAATVHTMTRDGRTLYKVQHSAHRDRVHAEQEQQRLIEAGFDASISNP